MPHSYEQKLRQNIWKLNWMWACNGAIIMLPIAVLFWQENGLGLTEIFILQAVFASTILLLEIPSGYLSDSWGRKQTLVIGSIFYLIGILGYCLGSSFMSFLFAEIAYGFGSSFFSGTADALTYDSLLELKRETESRRIMGNQFFYYFGTEAASGVLGGLLAPISLSLLGNLRLPVYASLLPFTCTIVFAFLLTEPKRHKIQETRHFQAMWNIGKKTLLHNAPLRNLILMSSIVSATCLLLFWFLQEYQNQATLPLAWFGVAHAMMVGSGAIVAKYTHLLYERLDDRYFFLGITIMAIGSTILLGLLPITLWGLSAFFVMRVSWSMKSPLIKDIINRMATSDVRATVLSVHSFINRLLFIIMAPFIGWAADIYSMRIAILLCGILAAISSILVFFFMRKDWEKIPK